MLRGIEDVKTLEMLSTLAGEEEVVTRSVSSPIESREGPVLSALRWLGRRPKPAISGPTVTTSTVRRRRMPVDELSRGSVGKALVIDERSELTYVGLTPFFSDEPWLSIVNAGPDPGLSFRGPELAPDGPAPGPGPMSRSPERRAGPPLPGLDFGR
jgi:hypothetical protein